MPQPVTHNFVCQQAIVQSLLGQRFWDSYGNFAGFGSFSPDLFYIEAFTAGKSDYGHAADDIHKDGSFDCYCCMLDAMKGLEASSEKCSKLKAFAYGFYAHIVTDCIFHPFVYRMSGDDWLTHPDVQYAAHKTLEARIDNFLIALRLESNPKYSIDIKVDCDMPLSGELDHGVHDMFRNALLSAYSNGVMNEYVYDRLSKDREENPVQKGYRGYYLANGFNLSFLSKFRKNMMNLEDVRPVGLWTYDELKSMNDEHHPWSAAPGNSVLSYSVRELFDKAVEAVEKVIQVSEEFLISSNQSSKVVLGASDVMYLQENMNIDTGLPASWNNDSGNRSDSDDIRFAAGVAVLRSSLA